MREIHADILNAASDEWILHQCNCVTPDAVGCAKHIFDEYPWANVYKKRSFKKDVPGTIEISQNNGRTIVALYVQYYPGPSKYDNDTKEMRLVWFKSCLNQIKDLPDCPKKFAIPGFIGCGYGGGNWVQYEEIIEEFEKESDIEFIRYVK